MNDLIGAYFGLELPPRRAGRGAFPYTESPCCAWVSSGRAAFESLLRSMPLPERVLVPRFTCDTVLAPLVRLGLPVLRYELTEEWLPQLPQELGAGDMLLITNYFGFTPAESIARAAAAHPGPCVVDATTALFAPPVPGIPTFYSLRKFAGVPDGGVAVAPFRIQLPEEQDLSSARARYLLERIELGAAAALPASEAAEQDISANPPRRMSPLTRAMVQAIDWEHIAAARRRNYAALHARLAALNRCALPAEPPSAPFCYPFVCAIPRMRDALIDSGIALPIFWPEVIRDTPAESPANELARRLLPLPLDQRYTPDELLRVLESCL